MLIVGLTGGIGSGKTTVSNLFEDHGIQVIDTDVIAHDLVNNDPSILNQIVALFGDVILQNGSSLDRKKLSKIVFSNKEYRQQLEDILHPRIRDAVKSQIQNYTVSNTPPKYIIVVIPLLFETGFRDLVDRVLVVITNETIRIQRIQQRDQRGLDEIQAIMNSQVDDEKRIREADDIIENNADFTELEAQIKQLDEKYSNLAIDK